MDTNIAVYPKSFVVELVIFSPLRMNMDETTVNEFVVPSDMLDGMI
jgi:hypothetical protein